MTTQPPPADAPTLFPVEQATAEVRLTDDCQRCGRPYQRCVCVLMPDRRRVEVTT